MKIREFIIMPHTADTMGLIHKPGTGPNNRFDFKNKANNRANLPWTCTPTTCLPTCATVHHYFDDES